MAPGAKHEEPAELSATQLRQWRQAILASQGLERRLAAGPSSVAQAVEQLGYVQIDTISVVARAHHHTLFNRVADYQPSQLDEALNQRQLFEYWAHAAAYLPMRDYRFALIRMQQQREKKHAAADPSQRRLMRKVLKRITVEGPLRSRDFESASTKSTGWWDWKPTKRALEALFMQGDLMVAARDGFQKRYDLRERVLPATVDTTTPSIEEYANYLIDTDLRSHAVTCPQSITHLRPGRDLRSAVREELDARLANHELVCKRHAGTDWYGRPQTQSSGASRGTYILSPFDNLVIQRKRLQQLFEFDYTLECYVPEPKRVHGYFTLPILSRGRFVARMDCKVHRRLGRCEIKTLHWEPPRSGQAISQRVMSDLVRTLRQFARFNDCTDIEFAADHQTREDSVIDRATNQRLREQLAP